MSRIVDAVRDVHLPCPECSQELRVTPCCSRRDCTTVLLACRCGGRGRMSIRLNYIEWKAAGADRPARWRLDEFVEGE